MCPSQLLWCSGRSHCVPNLAPRTCGGVTAVCPPQTLLNTWGSGWSQAGPGLLSRRLALLTDGQRCIGGYRLTMHAFTGEHDTDQTAVHGLWKS